jgi:hypothetical protein
MHIFYPFFIVQNIKKKKPRNILKHIGKKIGILIRFFDETVQAQRGDGSWTIQTYQGRWIDPGSYKP